LDILRKVVAKCQANILLILLNIRFLFLVTKTVKHAEQRIEGLEVKRIPSRRLSGLRNANDC
jgi:hypothetical protein